MLRNQFSWFQTDVSLVLFCSKRVVRYQTVSKHANWYAKKCISDRRVAGALLRRPVTPGNFVFLWTNGRCVVFLTTNITEPFCLLAMLCKTGNLLFSTTLLVALWLFLGALLFLKICVIPFVWTQCVAQFLQGPWAFVIVQGVVSSKLPRDRTLLVLIHSFEFN